MKYESSILKRLIDTYGVIGNPCYLSEIINEFIVRGKECFPNLFTYQSDWLAHIDEFGLKPSYTVSYTGQSIYAPNTLEKPVKSAILKGNTGYRDIDTGEFLETFEEGRNLELVSVKVPVLTTVGKNLWNPDNILYNKWINASNPNSLGDGTTRNVLDFTEVEQGEKLILSGCTPTSSGFFDSNKQWTEGANTTHLTGGGVTVPQNARYIRITFDNTVDFSNAQLEYGTQATPYEPHKSNILSTPQDLVLRGIGDVRDTLDSMTGKVTARIQEIVLGGSENWVISHYITGYTMFRYIVPNLPTSTSIRIGCMLCDKFNVENYINTQAQTREFITIRNGTTGQLLLNISNEKASDVAMLKEWLSQNPITVQYQLATESVKTVELTILDQNGKNVKQLMAFNGGTHFNTGSSVGSPLPTVSVSVETDLEETLKVCSLEGNTL